MKKVVFIIFVLFCNISLASSFSDTIKNEGNLVYNGMIKKVDENFFTLMAERKKCEEKIGRNIDKCQDEIKRRMKESLKNDLWVTVPLTVGWAAVKAIEHCANNRVGRAVGIGYGTVAGLPLFVIEADAVLKAMFLAVDHFMGKDHFLSYPRWIQLIGAT